MPYNIKSTYGHKLEASDGDIGHVKDFYFEENTGAIRYMVVDTGLWLMKRLVLLSPYAFEKAQARSEKNFSVNLTRKQIENSPHMDSRYPVSRTFEEDYHRYYGWPPYWDGDDIQDSGLSVVGADEGLGEEAPAPRHRHQQVRLSSTRGIVGYDVQASDGSIGCVSSFMVSDQTWIIGEWVIDTGHWYDGKQILLPSSAVTLIDHEKSKVFLNVARWDIQRKGAHIIPKAAAAHP